MTDAQRGRLVAAARSLLGVPFQHAGRNEHGLDCVGLLVLATRMAGMDVYDNRLYSQVVDPAYMLSELRKAAEPIDWLRQPLAGDVMLFRIGRSPQHVALVSDPGCPDPPWIVHCYQTAGMVVEHQMDATWAQRLVGIYSWRPS